MSSNVSKNNIFDVKQEEIERNAVRFEEEMYKSDADRDTAQNDLRVALASISGLTTQASLPFHTNNASA